MLSYKLLLAVTFIAIMMTSEPLNSTSILVSNNCGSNQMRTVGAKINSENVTQAMTVL